MKTQQSQKDLAHRQRVLGHTNAAVVYFVGRNEEPVAFLTSGSHEQIVDLCERINLNMHPSYKRPYGATILNRRLDRIEGAR